MHKTRANRPQSVALTLLIVWILAMAGVCGSARTLPEGADPAGVDGSRLLGSGTLPQGVNGSFDFWLFGVERPYAEERTRITDMLTATGWKVSASPERPNSPFSAHKRGDCVLYEDLRQGKDSLAEATLRVANPDLLERAHAFETQLLVTALWDCGLD
jgi:hypothetical protein